MDLSGEEIIKENKEVKDGRDFKNRRKNELKDNTVLKKRKKKKRH